MVRLVLHSSLTTRSLSVFVHILELDRYTAFVHLACRTETAHKPFYIQTQGSIGLNTVSWSEIRPNKADKIHHKHTSGPKAQQKQWESSEADWWMAFARSKTPLGWLEQTTIPIGTS